MSYANAAKGTTVSKATSKAESGETSLTTEISPSGDAASLPVVTAEATNGSVDDSTSSHERDTTLAPKKKTFAPAPVPEKSAWGAPVGLVAASGLIDSSKWPTPDQAVTEPAKPLGPKLAKLDSLTKWVPIPVKVTMSQSRGPLAKPARTRKKALKPKAKKDEASPNPENVELEGLVGDDSSADLSLASHSTDDGQLGSGYKYNTNFKPFRKFNNGVATNGQHSFQKRFPNQNSGYYHPQSYYNGLKSSYRQTTLTGRGTKQPNTRYFGNGGFRGQGGYMPAPAMGPTIPPVLSPKQNPLEALQRQIDYYFSLENLIRDIYLRKNMNSDGWVPLDLILNFKRVKIIVSLLEEGLTNEAESQDVSKAIVDAVTKCQNLDVQFTDGTNAETAKITNVQLRVKDNWQQWVMPEDAPQR